MKYYCFNDRDDNTRDDIKYVIINMTINIEIVIIVFLILFFLRFLSSVLIILMRVIIHIMNIAIPVSRWIAFNIGTNGEGS